MSDSQAGYGMTVVGNTDILVCGGVYNTSIATCLVYLSTVDAWWTTYPTLPTPVNSFTMLTIHGRPYVFGGINVNAVLNTVYKFDTNVWTVRANMTTVNYY